MKQLTLSFSAFAHDLGAHARITRDVSLPWHNEYVKADAVTRTARRGEFILNFLIGYGIAQGKAMKLMATTRTERSDSDQKAYDAARKMFQYHVVRGEAKSVVAESDPVEQLIAKFGKLTAAQQRRFLKAVAQ